jgi:hypothetical protein
VQGNKDDGKEERKLGGVCTYEDKDVNSVRNIITEGREGMPKSNGTPKSGNTLKNNGTPE